MKKLIFASVAFVMLAACNNELAETTSEATGADILTAEMPVTRTSLGATDAGVTVKWSAGDKLGVIFETDNKEYKIVPYTLYQGAGSTTGSFSGTKIPGATKVYAYYPYNETDQFLNNAVQTNLGNALPMGGGFAADAQSQVGLKNAAAVVALPLTLAKGTSYTITLASEGSNAPRISGNATIQFTGDVPTLAMTESSNNNNNNEQSVVVTGTGTQQYVYFPVAAGNDVSYPKLNLTVKADNESSPTTINVFQNKEFENGKAYDPDKSTEEQQGMSIAEKMLAKVLTNGGEITLGDSVNIAEMNVSVGDTVTIDLNGKSLTVTGENLHRVIQGKLTIKNGTLKVTAESTSGLFNVQAGGELTLEDVTANVENTEFFGFALAQGKDAKLNVIDCNLRTSGYYCMMVSNALLKNDKTALMYGEGAIITLKNSTLFATETGFLNNVPATVNIDNCEFSGNHQAAFFRGGTYTVTNSTFTLNASLETSGENHRMDLMNGWASGNMSAFAALTVGNYEGSVTTPWLTYQYPTTVTMSGCTVKVEGTNAAVYPAMHVCANITQGKGVSLTLGEGNSIRNDSYEWNQENDCIEYGTANITVNDKAVGISYKGMQTTSAE